MIDILDEISEIPFEVFKDKWEEKKPLLFVDWTRAQKEWFYMCEIDRRIAFSALCRNHRAVDFNDKPEEFLQHFNFPF